jgi:transposase
MGWVFGLKLHLIINDRGEILEFMLTPANVDDREPLKNKTFHERIFGKIFADKGYISQSLFEQLFVDGIHLVTKPRKNMKNSLMLQRDKILLRKRFLIETVNDQLKNMCQIEHTRHRSLANFLTNTVSGLIAYSFLPKKPSLKIESIQNNRIATAA